MPKRKKEPSIKQWMPVYIRDYLADTCALTTEQHGAYFLLLMEYWIRGGPIRNDNNELAMIARLSVDRWKKIRHQIVSYFQEKDGFLVHKRVEIELASARMNLESKQRAGHLGAEKRWHRDSTAIAEASHNDSGSIAEGITNECTHTHTYLGHVYGGNGGVPTHGADLYPGGRT